MKKKLFAATMSLLCATVMMVSSSFAWFTVSTTAEVSAVEATVVAEKNLEIAKATNDTTAPAEVTANDASDETKWGSKITSFTGAQIQYPATVVDGVLKTMTFDASGRTNGATAAATIGTMTEGIAAATAEIGGNTAAKVGAIYGVWLRSNVANTVTVTVDKTGATGALAAAADVKVGTMDGGNLTVADSVALTANTPTLVYILVYVDGDNAAATARNFAAESTISGIKVTFTSANTVTNDFGTTATTPTTPNP